MYRGRIYRLPHVYRCSNAKSAVHDHGKLLRLYSRWRVQRELRSDLWMHSNVDNDWCYEHCIDHNNIGPGNMHRMDPMPDMQVKANSVEALPDRKVAVVQQTVDSEFDRTGVWDNQESQDTEQNTMISFRDEPAMMATPCPARTNLLQTTRIAMIPVSASVSIRPKH